MAQFKPTRVDYIIAAIGIIPLAVASIWQSEIARRVNVAPKFVLAAGVALSVLIMLGSALLLKRSTSKYRVRPELQIAGVALLCLGVAYFVLREEIAELIGWQIRVGDGLMVFAAVATSLWLLSMIESASESNDSISEEQK